MSLLVFSLAISLACAEHFDCNKSYSAEYGGNIIGRDGNAPSAQDTSLRSLKDRPEYRHVE